MMGVYVIKINGSDKFYIGSSTNITRRKYYHFNRIRNNAHPNAHLQHSCNKYGLQNVSFEIVEEVLDSSELNTIEQKWLDLYWDSGKLFNVAKEAGRSFLGRKHSPETLDKMRKWQRDNGNSMKGKRHTDDTKYRMSIIHSKKPGTPRKLTIDQVREIRLLLAEGKGVRTLARELGHHRNVILRIRDGKRYKTFI